MTLTSGGIKEWIHNKDIILSDLSSRIINRDLLKICLQEKPFDKELS